VLTIYLRLLYGDLIATMATARRTPPPLRRAGGRVREEAMKHFATAMLALGITVAAVPAARAASTTCPPIPPPGSTVDSNITVTGTCILEDVKVGGNVTVDGAGTSLNVSGGKVGGNISADDCLSVFLGNGAAVGGNVTIQSCQGRDGYAGDSGLVRIDGNFRCVDESLGCIAIKGEIGGNMSLTGNAGAVVEENSVDGNLKADNNTEPPILVIGNSVGGNVEALGNNPAVVIIGNNTVGGHLKCQSGSQVFGNMVHGKTTCPEP
jgi:hypothetical protein